MNLLNVVHGLENCDVSFLTDGAEHKLLGGLICFGPTVPSDTATGYPKGALFIHSDATDESDSLYQNIGTAASANFNLATVASD